MKARSSDSFSDFPAFQIPHEISTFKPATGIALASCLFNNTIAK